jgi:hypothetical protein
MEGQESAFHFYLFMIVQDSTLLNGKEARHQRRKRTHYCSHRKIRNVFVSRFVVETLSRKVGGGVVDERGEEKKGQP